jgi:hypothetical protein
MAIASLSVAISLSLDLHTDLAAMLRVGNGPKRLKKFSTGPACVGGAIEIHYLSEVCDESDLR